MTTTAFNIFVSGLPGSGGTTLAQILADVYNLKYIYAGGVLKRWAELAGYDPKTDAFHTWEKEYGQAWDTFWEAYIKQKLGAETGYMYEGKTAGFLAPGEHAFKIMVVASPEIRAKRATVDGRLETLAERDNILRQRWLTDFSFDIFSQTQLKEHYDLVIDNSEMTVTDTLQKVANHLENSKFSTLFDHSVATPEVLTKYGHQFDLLIQNHQDPKAPIKASLIAKGLFVSPEQIFEEWRSSYSSKLEQLPNVMRKALI